MSLLRDQRSVDFSSSCVIRRPLTVTREERGRRIGVSDSMSLEKEIE